MTHPFRSVISPDRTALVTLLNKLALQDRYADALYVIAILKTDLAEDDQCYDPAWPKPGDAAPRGWHIYEAATRWCRGGFRGYPGW
jgi:hypothetical protein